MKRIIIMTAILAGVFISCDNDDSPNVKTPSVVLNTFRSEFPDATDVEWEEFKDDFEVEFEIEKIDHTAILSSDGNLIKYKYDILLSELPEPVSQSIDTNYDRNKIDDTEILKIGNTSYYQIEFDNNLIDDQVIFNASGGINSVIEYLD